MRTADRARACGSRGGGATYVLTPDGLDFSSAETTRAAAAHPTTIGGIDAASGPPSPARSRRCVHSDEFASSRARALVWRDVALIGSASRDHHYRGRDPAPTACACPLALAIACAQRLRQPAGKSVAPQGCRGERSQSRRARVPVQRASRVLDVRVRHGADYAWHSLPRGAVPYGGCSRLVRSRRRCLSVRRRSGWWLAARWRWGYDRGPGAGGADPGARRRIDGRRHCTN